MKKLIPIFVMLILSLPFLACKKGETGPAGAPGAPGVNPKYYDFDVLVSGGQYLLPDELTDDDLVIVYIRHSDSAGNLTYSNLPYTGRNLFVGDTSTVYNFKYSASGKRIIITSDYSGIDDRLVQFRVAVFKGVKAKKNKNNTQLLKYYETMALQNLNSY